LVSHHKDGGRIGNLPAINGLKKLEIIAKIVMFDVMAGLFLAWLVIDNPRRAPFLFVAIPFVVCANVAIVWWKVQSRASITLPAVYFFGLVFGIAWTVKEFEWWKVALLLVPLVFLIRNVQRFRRVRVSEAELGSKLPLS
jgi:hypothetical protein